MGTEMARHRIDVDQIWSDRVSEGFRGLTRYEKAPANIHGGLKGGYYKPITSHHWAAGVVQYYLLTGEEKAKECALRSAQGVILRQVNVYRDKPSSAGQGRDSGWPILILCAAYDITADKKYLDEATILWENNLKLKWKESGVDMGFGSNPILYFYCIYPLIQLYTHTGNQEIFDFLKAGADAKVWSDAAVEINHLSNLYAFIGWKTGNEEFVGKAEEAFAKAIGDSTDPPCYSDAGAWTKERAKRLRYGHVLQYCEWLKKQGKPRRSKGAKRAKGAAKSACHRSEEQHVNSG
jgi:hypothetical protein